MSSALALAAALLLLLTLPMNETISPSSFLVKSTGTSTHLTTSKVGNQTQQRATTTSSKTESASTKPASINSPEGDNNSSKTTPAPTTTQLNPAAVRSQDGAKAGSGSGSGAQSSQSAINNTTVTRETTQLTTLGDITHSTPAVSSLLTPTSTQKLTTSPVTLKPTEDTSKPPDVTIVSSSSGMAVGSTSTSQKIATTQGPLVNSPGNEQTLSKMTAVNGTSPSVTGPASSVTGTASSITGNTSSVTGKAPSVTGTAPSVTGTASSVPGTASSVPGKAPSITGTTPSVTGTTSPVTGNAPSITGTTSPVTGISPSKAAQPTGSVTTPAVGEPTSTTSHWASTAPQGSNNSSPTSALGDDRVKCGPSETLNGKMLILNLTKTSLCAGSPPDDKLVLLLCRAAKANFNPAHDKCHIQLARISETQAVVIKEITIKTVLLPKNMYELLKDKWDDLKEVGVSSMKFGDQEPPEETEDRFSMPLIITIVCMASFLLLVAALYGCCHQRLSQRKDQQRLTEELQTVENGYHDNPTLEVMETSSEMQEKKAVNLNGELGDSWIVPLDNLAKDDLDEEEDTHL
ncbi:Podocalyxin [Manis pentadactyla]|nr:Podocalyxin [Manis pentadactyla]